LPNGIQLKISPSYQAWFLLVVTSEFIEFVRWVMNGNRELTIEVMVRGVAIVVLMGDIRSCQKIIAWLQLILN
jgi:hypothetical protein